MSEEIHELLDSEQGEGEESVQEEASLEPEIEASEEGVTSFADPGEGPRPLRERLQPVLERLKAIPLFRTRRRMVVTLLVTVPLVLCLGCWLIGLIAFSDTARLVELQGLVQTREDSEPQWAPASINQILSRLDWVKTGGDSGARLLFFDVSSVDLEEDTEVRIDRITSRRSGKAVDVVLNVLFGNTSIRAVRFVDPSSTFRIDTPTASTMVRGARFTVQVADDGTTQIDLEEGSAEVTVDGEVVNLGMGQRITLDPDGLYTTDQVFEPDAQIMLDKISAAWRTSEDEVYLRLTETEINHFLAAMSRDPDFFLRDSQIWFVDGEARVATTITEPAEFDLSAAVSVHVVDGEIEPDISALSAGVNLPLPRAVLNPALGWVFDRLEGYLDQAYGVIEFTAVEIGDGYIEVTGTKLVD